jgi:hypothetical protein
MMGCLGFFNENYDIEILRHISKLSKLRSIMILEIEDRDWTLKNFQSVTHHEFKNIEVYEKWNFNSESSVSESMSKFYEKIRGNKDRLCCALELKTTLRLYSLHEIIRILKMAGWSYLASYENIRHHVPVKHQSQDIAVVAQKLRH